MPARRLLASTSPDDLDEINIDAILLVTRKPERARCSTSRSATVSDLWTRLRP
jgi:hypothetical protein